MTDAMAFLAAIFPLTFAGVVLLFTILGKSATVNLLQIGVIFFVTGIGVLIWRMGTITTLFNDAQEVTATITDISFFRDRGRVSYIFTYQNQKYLNGNAIIANERTRQILVGEQRMVLVDRNNPKKSIIKDLYY